MFIRTSMLSFKSRNSPTYKCNYILGSLQSTYLRNTNKVHFEFSIILDLECQRKECFQNSFLISFDWEVGVNL